MLAEKVKVGMHFNYQSLIHAFDIFECESHNLRNGKNDDKCDLFWRQVIGWEERWLPARDRQVFAQGLWDVVKKNEPLQRKFKFKYGAGNYPITAGDNLHSGLGFDYGIGMGAGRVSNAAWRMGGTQGPTILKNYIEKKQNQLLACYAQQELVAQHRPK
jgi:hypothetical protein